MVCWYGMYVWYVLLFSYLPAGCYFSFTVCGSVFFQFGPLQKKKWQKKKIVMEREKKKKGKYCKREMYAAQDVRNISLVCGSLSSQVRYCFLYEGLFSVV